MTFSVLQEVGLGFRALRKALEVRRIYGSYNGLGPGFIGFEGTHESTAREKR